MKVKTLVTLLNQCDPESDVLICLAWTDYLDFEQVAFDPIRYLYNHTHNRVILTNKEKP